MIIRAEQMTVFEESAEESFRRRLNSHLLEQYPKTVVKLPDSESAIEDLSDETRCSLIGASIERARSYGLNYESSIAAFCALMFEVAPNFDAHQLSQLFLNDEEIEPNARVDELLEHLTEKNWETIKNNYDVNAWHLNSEEQN
jgi:hypothetical protein